MRAALAPPLLAALLGLLACALALACALSPLGRRQLLIYDDATMSQMGEASFVQIKRDLDPARDRATTRHVRCVADAIVDALLPADGAPAAWEIVVFDEPSANAFALPGGKIGVHAGLLEVARDEHQLAAVIGHEIGHVLAQHANERMSQTQLVLIGIAVTGAIVSKDGLSTGERRALALMGLGAQYGVLLPFSRKHETEADLIGLDLMARAGFDPEASVALWQNMDARGSQPLQFLSTHPSHGTRIESLRGRMPSARRLAALAHAQGRTPACRR